MTKRIKRGGRQILNHLTVDKPAPRFDTINLILVAIFIGSLALTGWEIKIYQNTFIPLKIPLLIWLLTGLIFTPILRKTLTIYIETPNILLQVVYSLVTCGGLFVSIFMLSNYYLADKETFVINEKIISTGHMGTSLRGHCPQAFIIINHDGQEKQLVYFCDTPVEKYQIVDLTLSKGLFGFEIIRESKLNPDQTAAYMRFSASVANGLNISSNALPDFSSSRRNATRH